MKKPPKPIKLGKRVREALRLRESGDTIEQVADKMGISPHTVISYQTRASEILDLDTTKLTKILTAIKKTGTPLLVALTMYTCIETNQQLRKPPKQTKIVTLRAA